jgi:hypothetical protein
MTHQVSRSNTLLRLQAEQELANALLESDAVVIRQNDGTVINESDIEVLEAPNDKISYPWNPADSGSDDFFNQLEQRFPLDGVSESEMNDRADAFFANLDSLFSATSLQTSLAHKFATVPQTLLNAIARQAQHVAQSSANLADQLIQCAQVALPQWAEDDLLVLARPLAYAMRGEESNVVDATVKSIRSSQWDQMSETEQARMTLAIARYALKELQNQ